MWRLLDEWKPPRDLPGRIVWVIGVAGMAGGLFLGLVGLDAIPQQLLDGIELPNSLGATRIAAPDGRVFIVSEAIGRVQRYGPSGFERSFGVDSRGGFLEAGMSAAGNLLICSNRAGHSLITYDPDGKEAGQRQPCQPNTAHQGRLPDTPVFAANARVPLIADSWVAAVAVPLWHPLSGWLVGLCAWLYLNYRRRVARPSG
jgi:hypothetical protein